MKLLFLGDIVGKPGRLAVRQVLPKLIHREQVNFVIANCENVSGGAGVEPGNCRELLEAGIDVLTSGNHIWRKREIVEYLDQEPRLLRPHNFPPGAAGTGWRIFNAPDGTRIAVVNLIGRVFMDSVDCPFQAADAILRQIGDSVQVIFVDMHCDATSEKGAMGWHLAGRVSAVVGSHTHVQTADERVLPPGTAFLTDAGMCGPIDSVIGVKAELAIRRFVTHLPTRFETASGRTVVQGAVVTVDAASGRATAITRVQEYVDKP
ncbi:MAG: TIGR00282 family metallophosphoesterase [Candidatus Binatia bacterium]